MAGPAAVHDLSTPAAPPGGEEVVRKRKHKTTIRVAALNSTAMMDLVLNLLLFFVLSASFQMAEGIIPASLPTGGPGGGGSAADTVKPPENPIIISLRDIDGRSAQITIEGTSASFQDNEQLFETLYKWNNKNSSDGIYKDDNPITIQPSKSATWKQVVDAFNAVIRAKYKDVGFAPSPN